MPSTRSVKSAMVMTSVVIATIVTKKELVETKRHGRPRPSRLAERRGRNLDHPKARRYFRNPARRQLIKAVLPAVISCCPFERVARHGLQAPCCFRLPDQQAIRSLNRARHTLRRAIADQPHATRLNTASCQASA